MLLRVAQGRAAGRAAASGFENPARFRGICECRREERGSKKAAPRRAGVEESRAAKSEGRRQLRHALPPQIVVLASDAVAHPEPAFPVTLAVHSDVLDAVERPDLVLICWHAPNQDFTAVVRDKESVQE